MSSSSSATSPSFYHHVYLNFGVDTLHNFTSDLLIALLGKRIEVCFDNPISRGDEIFPDVYKAIKESRISVIVFSKIYANSKWCLDELVHILECREKYNQIVITIYYDIDPLDVRNQMGTFADAFKEHEYRCEKSLVQRWRSALTEATYLSGGYYLAVIKLQTVFIDKIVGGILEGLNDMSLNLPENSHIMDIGEQASNDDDEGAITTDIGEQEGDDEDEGAITTDIREQESDDEDEGAIQKTIRERIRSENINERMRLIMDLVPGGNKVVSKTALLDETIDYMQSLQRQVEFLSMKLATLNPRLSFDVATKYITTKRMFVATNFILEVPTAIFDQLSSKHKPQYALVSMLISFTTMLICIMELVYKGGEGRVRWRWREKIPWFYYSTSIQKPFGTVTDFIGLICAIFQCIFTSVDYAFYLRNSSVPIKISVWPLVFAFCLLCSNFSKHPHNKML